MAAHDRHRSPGRSSAGSAAGSNEFTTDVRRSIWSWIDSSRSNRRSSTDQSRNGASPKTVFVCQECGAQSPKWLGRCADCGAWNSLVEERAGDERRRAAGGHRYALGRRGGVGAALRRHRDRAARAAVDRHRRVRSRARRRRRAGSLVLLGGEPGIGKSTLLLQAAANMARTDRPGALQLGRGIRAPDQVARRAARRSATRRCICWPKPASSASSRRSPASSRRSSSSTRSRRCSR